MDYSNAQGLSALKQIIEDWKNEKSWVKDVPNDLVRKDIGAIYGPNGEVMLVPQIVDTTWLPDGKFHLFAKSEVYVTKGLNNSMADVEYDAKELKKILNNLTTQMKCEIEQQLAEWEATGVKVMTSNPYLF